MLQPFDAPGAVDFDHLIACDDGPGVAFDEDTLDQPPCVLSSFKKRWLRDR